MLGVPVEDVLFGVVGVLVPVGKDALHGVGGEELEPVSLYVIRILSGKVFPDVLTMNGQEHDAAGPGNAAELLQPAELVVLVEVGEDRDGVDEIERPGGIFQRRERLVDAELGEVEVAAAPGDRLVIYVRAVE